jgi:hypothetical protein
MIRWILKRLGAENTNIRTNVPRVIEPPALPANKTIIYRLTDPAGDPALVKQEDLTEQVSPYFKVIGFVGGGFDLQTLEGQAASLYMNIDKAIKNYGTFAEKSLDHWAAVSVLLVLPRAGRKMNAYYNRRTLSFFYDLDRATNTDVFAADSPDVTIHELGHAILDSKRTDFWNVANLEIQSLHESWGDIFSIISQLQYPEVAKAVLQLTNGNLRTNNVISSLAEQLGQAIYDETFLVGRNSHWLRSALNNFKYVCPNTLSADKSTGTLSAEPHSFSRILTGTAYDLMIAIYETEKGVGKDDLTALLDAAKGLGWYIDRTLTRMPNTTQAFYAFASTLLRVDREMSNSYYQQKFTSILKYRNLITSDLKMLQLDNPPKLVDIRLCDVLRGSVIALDVNPLYNVEIQVSDEGWGAWIAAKKFVDYLHQYDLVSPNDDTPFEVLGGKLVRNHFDSIEDYFPNWMNPTQPEFYRHPKPENNFNPCGCKEQLEKFKNPELARRIVRESRIRHRFQ